MPNTQTHTVTLTKPAKRNLQPKVIDANITDLLSTVNTKNRAVKGWRVDRDLRNAPEGSMICWRQRVSGQADVEYEYDINLLVTFDPKDDRTPDRAEFPAIVRAIATKVGQPGFGRWTVGKVDGSAYVPVDGTNVIDGGEDIAYAEASFPQDWKSAFDHLFGLDPHITRVKKALDAAMQSGWRNRFHCALIGDPGCGKSDIAGTFRDVLGKDAVWVLDGTATTQAGAIKELSEMEILPRIIIIEEIEKAPEATMTFLLGVLDTRAEVRKVTARGNIQRETKCFCIATVNDLARFESLQSGALASRFANKVFFRRPSRATLARILRREVIKVDGNEKWIEPTLNLADELGLTDPRALIAHCLCGQDDLLNGTYQKMLRETAEPKPEVIDLEV